MNDCDIVSWGEICGPEVETMGGKLLDKRKK